MFSNIKNRFNKKGKRAAALLITVTMLCGFTGCGKSETGSSSTDSVTSTLQSTPTAESKDSQNPVINSDNIGSSGTQGNAQSDFDFDEAVKNITLFGQKISLPCYWSDFGEDFSHDDIYRSGDGELSCQLMYKGKIVGTIFFDKSADDENIAETENIPIILIVLGFTDYGYPYDSHKESFLESIGYYTGLLELNFDGISMSSTETDIIAKVGEPSKTSEGGSFRYLDYKYDNGYLHFVIDVNKIPNGIMELYIGVNQD